MVYNNDYTSALSKLSAAGAVLDIVFLDPPYDETEYYKTALELLQEYELVDEGSLVIAEHLYNNNLLEQYGKFTRIKEKKYGSIGVDVYIYEYQSQAQQ